MIELLDKIEPIDKKISIYPKSVLPYTHNSSIMCVPEIANIDKITKCLADRHVALFYTQTELRAIIDLYITASNICGVDWILALAQNVHETNWLNSWWSAPPRRNPAGIAVSGLTARKQKNKNWSYDDRKDIWRSGASFDSWKNSIYAHMGLLLTYACKDHDLNVDQIHFLNQSNWKAPTKYRGVAPTLLGLNGKWAVPGKTYAQRIAKIANYFVR